MIGSPRPRPGCRNLRSGRLPLRPTCRHRSIDSLPRQKPRPKGDGTGRPRKATPPTFRPPCSATPSRPNSPIPPQRWPDQPPSLGNSQSPTAPAITRSTAGGQATPDTCRHNDPCHPYNGNTNQPLDQRPPNDAPTHNRSTHPSTHTRETAGPTTRSTADHQHHPPNVLTHPSNPTPGNSKTNPLDRVKARPPNPRTLQLTHPPHHARQRDQQTARPATTRPPQPAHAPAHPSSNTRARAGRTNPLNRRRPDRLRTFCTTHQPTPGNSRTKPARPATTSPRPQTTKLQLTVHHTPGDGQTNHPLNRRRPDHPERSGTTIRPPRQQQDGPLDR